MKQAKATVYCVRRCVACGQDIDDPRYQRAGLFGRMVHVCAPSVKVAQVVAEMRAGNGDPFFRPSWTETLEEGFRMLSDDYYGDE